MSDQDIPVIILCGGRGTRMGDQTLPKPLVEIGGRPILWHVMKIFASQGFTHFVLALGYRGDLIKRYFLEYDWQSRDFTLHPGGAPVFHGPSDISGWQITFMDTGLQAMTGARVRKAISRLPSQRFFVTYADGVADIDLRDLLSFHQRQGVLATLTGVRALARYGLVRVDAGHRVLGFHEKPLVDTPVNGGFFVFERDVLPYLGKGEDVVLERAPFDALAADAQLAMYEHRGFWYTMDTLKEAQELTLLWEESAPWKLW